MSRMLARNANGLAADGFMRFIMPMSRSWPTLRASGLLASLGASLLFLTACSTPQSRIEKDPALYASFPPAVQANVKQGKIAIGYTPQMVYVGWGRPDSKRTITEEKTKREVWIYLGSRQEFDGYDFVQIPRCDGNGRPCGFYIDQRPRYRTVFYERASVTFTDGKVSKIVQ